MSHTDSHPTRLTPSAQCSTTYMHTNTHCQHACMLLLLQLPTRRCGGGCDGCLICTQLLSCVFTAPTASTCQLGTQHMCNTQNACQKRLDRHMLQRQQPCKNPTDRLTHKQTPNQHRSHTHVAPCGCCVGTTQYSGACNNSVKRHTTLASSSTVQVEHCPTAPATADPPVYSRKCICVGVLCKAVARMDRTASRPVPPLVLYSCAPHSTAYHSTSHHLAARQQATHTRSACKQRTLLRRPAAASPACCVVC